MVLLEDFFTNTWPLQKGKERGTASKHWRKIFLSFSNQHDKWPSHWPHHPIFQTLWDAWHCPIGRCHPKLNYVEVHQQCLLPRLIRCMQFLCLTTSSITSLVWRPWAPPKCIFLLGWFFETKCGQWIGLRKEDAKNCGLCKLHNQVQESSAHLPFNTGSLFVFLVYFEHLVSSLWHWTWGVAMTCTPSGIGGLR
jgi:hypothetical protein